MKVVEGLDEALTFVGKHGKVLVYLALAIVVVSVFVKNAQGADPSDESCSLAAATGALGSERQWRIKVHDDTGVECNEGDPIVDVPAGSVMSLWCTEAASGASPPGQADSITVKLVIDDTDFGNAAPAAFRTINVGTSCLTPQEFTIACTSDGTSGGSPRYGIMRLHIRAVLGGVGGYDTHSENGGTQERYGIVRCNPRPTTFQESNPQSTYVGGDTIGVSYAVNVTPYETVSSTRMDVICDSVTNTLGTDHLSTSTRTLSTTIQGANAVWPDDCDLTLQGVITLFSGITGYEDINAFKWVGTPPSGVTIDSDTTLTRVLGKTLDRTLTETGHAGSHPTCAASVGGSPVDVMNRGETATFHGHWVNVRGSHVANNRAGIGYATRSGISDTTDFPSANFLFGSQGQSQFSSTARTTATVTDGTPAPDYRCAVETFGSTSRTTSVLYNWGNGTFEWDVSATWTFDSLLHSKSPSGGNVTTFTIGADQEFLQPLGLTNAHGGVESGRSVSCVRTDPNNNSDPAVSHGTTDGNGDASQVEYTPSAPEGEWTFECTSSGDGNTASYVITYFYVSAFTADLDITIVFREFSNASGDFLNVTVVAHQWNDETFDIVHVAPDNGNDVYFWIDVVNGNLHENVWGRSVMNETESFVFYAHFPLNDTLKEGRLYAITQMNISGRPFLDTDQYVFHSATVAESDTMTDVELAVQYLWFMLASLGLIVTGRIVRVPFVCFMGSVVAVVAFIIHVQSETVNETDFAGSFIIRFLILVIAAVGLAMSVVVYRHGKSIM